jgi:aspyridone synthetase trans-acting enoyl reductase
MSTQQAIVSNGKGRYQLTHNAKIPTIKPKTILCKVHAVALNPVDAKMIDYSDSPGAVGGSDFAGEVVGVGADVTRFCLGDRVFAMMFGLNPIDESAGAFAQYTLAEADLACKIPDWMTYEQGSTMGVGVATAGMALFRDLNLPMQGNDVAPRSFHVLINGGATATGTIAIQLVKRLVLWIHV